MHPIERLRYVARASGAAQDVLVRETAGALASLGFDPAGLVTACRRIVDRHLASGPLWSLCARVLTAADPVREAWAFADEVAADPTAVELSHALPDEATVLVLGWPDVIGEALVRRGDLQVLLCDTDGQGDGLARRLQRADVPVELVDPAGLGGAAAASTVVLVEATAVGPDGFVGTVGSRAAAAVGYCAEVPVWLVAGVGRLQPGRTWEALTRRLAEEQPVPWEAADEVVPLAMVSAWAGPGGVVEVDEGLAGPTAPVTPELFKPTAF